MTLKVLHVISDRERRGAQLFAIALSKELSSRGYDSSVCALQANRRGSSASGSGLDVEAFGRSRFSMRGGRALRQAMKRADITVAHGSTTVLATALAKTDCPIVIRQIGDTFAWADSPGKRARLLWAYKRSARVVALSESAKTTLVNGFDLEADKITVIANAVSTSHFANIDEVERLAARREFDLGEQCAIAMVGALAKEKGVDVLLAALSRSSQPGSLRLLVVGDGPERGRLEAQAADLGVGVRFCGSLSDIRPVLAAADLFVLASRTESMPAALVEAGAAGLACIATDVGSVDELIRHDRNGILVRPDDASALAAAIDDLATDVDRRKLMGETGSQMAQRFDIENIAPVWVEALELAHAGQELT